MYKILFIICLVTPSLWAENVSIDLSTITLPTQAQKALHSYTAEKVKAEQQFRETMDKIKANAIRDLEKQLKKASDLEKLAIQNRIDAIAQETAVNLFGEPIQKPAPPMPTMLQAMLDGKRFIRSNSNNISDIIAITGESATFGNTFQGKVTVFVDYFEIEWANNNITTIKLREDGVPILIRTEAFGGGIFELKFVDE